MIKKSVIRLIGAVVFPLALLFVLPGSEFAALASNPSTFENPQWSQVQFDALEASGGFGMRINDPETMVSVLINKLSPLIKVAQSFAVQLEGSSSDPAGGIGLALATERSLAIMAVSQTGVLKMLVIDVSKKRVIRNTTEQLFQGVSPVRIGLNFEARIGLTIHVVMADGSSAESFLHLPQKIEKMGVSGFSSPNASEEKPTIIKFNSMKIAILS